MKISEKEKIMLGILGIALAGVAYYYLSYLPTSEKIEAKKLEFQTIEDEYNKKQSEIAMTEQNQKDINLLNFTIKDISEQIYPDIWQTKLIKELSDLARKANIEVTFGYTKEGYAPISDYFVSKEEEIEMANTLEKFLDDYNAAMPPDKKIDYKKVNGETPVEKPKEKEEKKEETPENADSSLNIKQMKVNANFNGKYENVIKFIKLVEDYKYLIAIPDITMAPSGNEEILVSLSMEFYSAPRLNNDFDNYYDWKAETKKGKNNPFKNSYTDPLTIENEDAQAVSLNIALRPFNSDMPSITVARPNDSTGRTKLLNDDNKLEEVTVEFTEKDGEYFVKYKLGSQVYPSSGDGIDFVPKGNIKVWVTSEKRINGQDLVAVKLNIKNSTKKKVEVEITGDDKSNPRVKMNTEGNVYYTTK